MSGDDLTLVANGRQMKGWTGVRVTRGVERMPSDFDLLMTERFPRDWYEVEVNPGDTCQVLLGSDVVLTGYIDTYIPEIDGGRHQVRVAGRGKCEDLVDCSAEWQGGQISGSTVLGIAQKLAAPYGITVTGAANVGNPVPQFNVNWGETAWEIIERLCRIAALLAYEDQNGNLVLAQVGSQTHASAIVEGQNVERAACIYSMAERYSDVVVRWLPVDTFADTGDQMKILGDFQDPFVRHRLLYLIVETGDATGAIAKQRAAWEVARRFGRSAQLRVTVDSWRDGAGTLWQPNQLVPLSLSSMRIYDKSWAISEVTYRRDERGTHADLLIMDPSAFTPEPLLYMPLPRDAIPGAPGPL